MSSAAQPQDRVIVITGAAKGLGLEWVRQYSKESNTFIVAVVRAKAAATELQPLLNGKVVAVELELSDFEKYDTVAKEIGEITGGRVDVLINNAGAMIGGGASPTTKLSETTLEEWRKTFDINTFSPIFFTTALLPLLNNGREKRIVNISTSFARLDLHKSYGGSAAFSSYSASKSALNMISLKQHYDLQKEGYTVVSLEPGWVQTDLFHNDDIKSQAPLTVDVSVKAQKALVDKLDTSYSGNIYSLSDAGEMVLL